MMKQVFAFLILSFSLYSSALKSQIIWYEDFSLPNFTITDTGATAWTIDLAYDCGGSVTGYYYVLSGQFQSYDTDCDARWISQWIDVGAYSSVDVYGVLDGVGGMETSGVFADTLKIGIRIDGSSTITWLDVYAGTTVQNSVSCGGAAVGADSIQIVIQERSTGGDEIHFFDDITVSVSNSLPTGGGDTIFSRGDGNWNNTTNWSFTDGGASCGCMPDSNSIVYISCGDVVNMNVDGFAREVHVLFGGRIEWTVNDVELNISSSGLIDISVGAYMWENGRSNAWVDFEGGGTNTLAIYGEETGLEMDRVRVNYPCSLFIEGNGRIDIEDDFELNADDISVINNFTSQFYILDNFEFFGDDNYFSNDGGDIYVDGLWGIDGLRLTFINNDTIYVDEVIDGNVATDGQLTNNGYIRVNTSVQMSNNTNNFRVDNFGTVQIDDNLFQSPVGASACEWHNRAGGYLYLGHNNAEVDWEVWANYDSNTVDYFRSADQLFVFTPQDSYWNLYLTGSGIKRTLGNLDINGNVRIEGTAQFDPNTGNDNLQVAGNWRVTSANATPFNFGTEQVTFDGISIQTVNANAGAEFYNVILNKSDTLNLQSAMRINSAANMTFTAGYVSSDSINRLRIANNATVSGASNASYVDGRIEKIGDDTFRFPVGDGGNYQPVAITAPTDVTHAFTAQYVMQNPDMFWDTASLAATINHVSTEEFWILNRTTGNSNVSVTLVYDANSGGVTNRDSLVVARWNGTQWADEGNGGTTGTNAAGSVVSLGAVTNFSPFTLGSVINSLSANPLPIKLIAFTAESMEENVLLSWSTITEIKSDRFRIEKLVEQNWVAVGEEIAAAGFSNSLVEYQHFDHHPRAGNNSYRLIEINFDGYAEVVAYSSVYFTFPSTDLELYVFPNPVLGDELKFVVDGHANYSAAKFSIFSVDGRLLINGSVFLVDGYNTIDIADLETGPYFMVLQSAEFNLQAKFLKTKKPR